MGKVSAGRVFVGVWRCGGTGLEKVPNFDIRARVKIRAIPCKA